MRIAFHTEIRFQKIAKHTEESAAITPFAYATAELNESVLPLHLRKKSSAKAWGFEPIPTFFFYAAVVGPISTTRRSVSLLQTKLFRF